MSYPQKVEVTAILRTDSFSIIEMLTAIFIGTLLIFSISHFYQGIYQDIQSKNELLFLQKEAHQIMDYLKQHIQHIGYQGKNREGNNLSLFLNGNKMYYLESEHCLMFFYDVDGDGCIGHRNKKQPCIKFNRNNTKEIGKEIFGFKLHHSELYLYHDNQDKCNLISCKNLLTCPKEGWQAITSQDNFLIEKLNFKWLIEDKLLEVSLTLTSINNHQIKYDIKSYIYIINS